MPQLEWMESNTGYMIVVSDMSEFARSVLVERILANHKSYGAEGLGPAMLKGEVARIVGMPELALALKMAMGKERVATCLPF